MAVVLTAALPAITAWPASAQDALGTELPPDFPQIIDASLGVPVIGFGAGGTVTRTPVVFLHGNNDTPYPTDCNGAFGRIHDFAQHFLDNGYAPAELWGLGYQGDQCDLLTDPPQRSGEAHSTVANVADLRAFVHAVLAYTGADRIDIVGHSLGTTLAREWMRQDAAHNLVRRLVGVDGPNHGIINCSPSPANYWQTPPTGGFSPDSAICTEYGAIDTPFLATLNADPAPGPTQYLMVVNADTSFVFFDRQDGLVPPVPAEDRHGNPHDFSGSARLPGADVVEVVGQGRYDDALQSAHLGIVASPEVWDIALEYLSRPEPPATPAVPAPVAADAAAPAAPEAAPAAASLPATGGGGAAAPLVLLGLAAAAGRGTRVPQQLLLGLRPASRTGPQKQPAGQARRAASATRTSRTNRSGSSSTSYHQ